MSAGRVWQRSEILDLLEKIKDNNLTAVVIDMKDATGYVTYDSNLDFVNEIGSEEIRIRNNKNNNKKRQEILRNNKE